jgi:predicted nucleic acid-binding protein
MRTDRPGDVALILDTNALYAAADHDPAIVGVLSNAGEISLPVVALGEYRYGISQSRHQIEYESWIKALLEDCRVLDITEETTRYYAGHKVELRKKGTPMATNDLWIAALCRQHGLPLLSRDKHFDVATGVNRTDW